MHALHENRIYAILILCMVVCICYMYLTSGSCSPNGFSFIYSYLHSHQRQLIWHNAHIISARFAGYSTLCLTLRMIVVVLIFADTAENSILYKSLQCSRQSNYILSFVFWVNDISWIQRIILHLSYSHCVLGRKDPNKKMCHTTFGHTIGMADGCFEFSYRLMWLTGWTHAYTKTFNRFGGTRLFRLSCHFRVIFMLPRIGDGHKFRSHESLGSRSSNC